MKKTLGLIGVLLTSLSVYSANRVSRYDEFKGGTFTGTTFTGTTLSGGNLQLSGNSLISTDTDGNINFNPDGSGLSIFTDLTALTVPYLGASKQLLSSSVTNTELGYLSGVTSSLQAQLGLKLFINSPVDLNLLSESEARFQDNSGGEYMGLKAPFTVTSSTTLTLPDGDGTSGQALTTNGSGTLEWADSGSGGTGKNYILNPGGENGTVTDWAVYDDGAVSEPVDGTGGLPPSTTYSVTSGASQLISGTQTLYLIQNTAVDHQGTGISTDFEIDREIALGAKKLNVSFKYAISDLASNGDYKVFVYDIDNTTLIGAIQNDDDGDLIAGNFNSSGNSVDGTQSFAGKFYATNSLNYRLIVHRTDTSTTYQNKFYFDDVKVSPDEFIPGFMGHGWKSFTPTGSWTTNTTYTGKYRRVGDSLELLYDITLSGAPNAATLTLNYPTGFSQDETKIVFSGSVAAGGIGEAADSSASASHNTMAGIQESLDRIIVRNSNGGGVANVTQAFPFVFASGDGLTIRAVVPMTGLSASGMISTTENLFKNVDVRGEANGSTVLTSGITDIDFTEVADPLNLWDGSSYVAVESGKVVFSGAIVLSTTTTGSIFAHINGTRVKAYGQGHGTNKMTFSGSLYLEAGESLTFRINDNKTLTSDTEFHWIDIASVKDTSVLAVSGETEIISASSSTRANHTGTGWVNITTVNVPKGKWKLWGAQSLYNNGVVTAQNAYIAISAFSGTTTTDHEEGKNEMVTPITETLSTFEHGININPFPVTLTDTTTYYLKENVGATTANIQRTYSVFAERVQ